MKILLLGNTGQVGWELNRTLITLGKLTALDYPQIDMANSNNVVKVVRDSNPDIIINATAYTNVDKAESEPDLAMAINGTGPGILAEEAKKLGAGLIHYSTDFVFDGTKGKPYTEQDTPNPVNVYGKTKLAGEQAVQSVGVPYLIFRTSWVFSNRRPCFVTKVLEWAKQKSELQIVDDQISTPTWARVLAETTAQVVAQCKEYPLAIFSHKSGIYNLTSNGYCSRYEWAKTIINHSKRNSAYQNINISPAKTTDFPSPAARPPFSALEIQKIYSLNITLPTWEAALALCLAE